MIANEKTIKMLRDVYIHDNLVTWPESSSMKKCFCWAVSLCSVMVILVSIIASM